MPSYDFIRGQNICISKNRMICELNMLIQEYIVNIDEVDLKIFGYHDRYPDCVMCIN